MTITIHELRKRILESLSEGIIAGRKVKYMTKRRALKILGGPNHSLLMRVLYDILHENFGVGYCLLITRSRIVYCRREDCDSVVEYLRQFDSLVVFHCREQP